MRFRHGGRETNDGQGAHGCFGEGIERVRWEAHAVYVGQQTSTLRVLLLCLRHDESRCVHEGVASALSNE